MYRIRAVAGSSRWNTVAAATISPGSWQRRRWRRRHVAGPSVRGRNAGQAIAKVGDFDERYTPGIGLVELGMMISSNGPPTHYCPFAKIAAGVKTKMLSDLAAIVSDNQKRGLSIGTVEQPGCTNLNPIEG